MSTPNVYNTVLILQCAVRLINSLNRHAIMQGRRLRAIIVSLRQRYRYIAPDCAPLSPDDYQCKPVTVLITRICKQGAGGEGRNGLPSNAIPRARAVAKYKHTRPGRVYYTIIYKPIGTCAQYQCTANTAVISRLNFDRPKRLGKMVNIYLRPTYRYIMYYVRAWSWYRVEKLKNK